MFRRIIKAFRLLPTSRYRRGLCLGVAAAIEHRAILANLPPLSLILDAGANKGQFSLVAAELHPRAVIHAFEPLPGAADRYQRLFAGQDRIHLHRVALGACPGIVDLHLSARADCSSLLEIGEAQTQFAPGSQEIGRLPVPVERLDQRIDVGQVIHPALLKIDVQGTEQEVLAGAGSVLAHLDYVLVEASFRRLYAGQPLAHDLIRYLDQRGFHLIATSDPARDKDGAVVQTDMLFRRDQG